MEGGMTFGAQPKWYVLMGTNAVFGETYRDGHAR
jgi:hypothetical protein